MQVVIYTSSIESLDLEGNDLGLLLNPHFHRFYSRGHIQNCQTRCHNMSTGNQPRLSITKRMAQKDEM
jgi:hypothetical protein